MTEKQILAKIDKWDNDDKISAIIEFVEDLPVEDKTPAVLSELGRAYNNLYWLEPTEKNREYLKKAVSIFNYIKDDINPQSWNYRIGYAYFFLDNIEKAKEHLSQTKESNGEELYSYLIIAEEKGIKPTEVAPKGELKFEFLLELFYKGLQKNATPLIEVLGAGVTDAELDAFEQKIGVKLPEHFRTLHKTFSGQSDNSVLFFNNSQRFVALSEIEGIQQKWLNFVKDNYGDSWQDILISEEDFLDDDIIKNQLFSKKWIPFMVRTNDQGIEEFLCFDFDPIEKDDFGQLISIAPNPSLENYFIDYVEQSLWMWLYNTINSIVDGNITYSEEFNSMMFANNTYNNSFEPAYYEEGEQIALEQYISEKLGKFEDVFHELVSPDIHCDIYVIKPTPERNYYTLVTGGMGAYDMNVPEWYEGAKNAELVIHLPADWNINSQEEKDYWPIRWLKILSRLPIEQQTYLGWGHTIPTGDYLEGTQFDCFMLIGTDDKNNENALAKLPSGREVQFFTLIALYEQETLFKLDHSAESILELFEEKDIPYPPVIDVNRPNVCPDYQANENNGALDDIAWAFNHTNYTGLMQFWEDVRQYNNEIGQDLEYFNPFATIFNTTKIKVIYEAWIKSEKDLFSIERLVENPENVFAPENSEDGMYQANIIAEFTTGDNNNFGALELLFHIHNCLQNKELGDHIFFEGFQIEGYEDDGTPVLYLYLGS
ncbi:MAG: suppressor of fused domain protein [Bacteroidota bacterium]|nr:suppressor of fused domain protein [Bacteroidota bacterium]